MTAGLQFGDHARQVIAESALNLTAEWVLAGGEDDVHCIDQIESACASSWGFDYRENGHVGKRVIKLGLVLDPAFADGARAVSVLTAPLIAGIRQRFEVIDIPDQAAYGRLVESCQAVLSLEPDWASPRIRWGGGVFRSKPPPRPSLIWISDPHKAQWRERYILRSGITDVLAYYDEPTRRHFPQLADRVRHFPWSIPDEHILTADPGYAGSDGVHIFGAAGSPAYSMRNWCREQAGVIGHDNSGVEKPRFTTAEYWDWLAGHDAMIAAGSLDPTFGLTTPKYFEIAAVGALLFAQRTPDLKALGFEDGVNCIAFDQADFRHKLDDYLAKPGSERYLAIRAAGRDLIRQRHALSVRLDQLEALIASRL